jgi:hypothetical protein
MMKAKIKIHYLKVYEVELREGVCTGGGITGGEPMGFESNCLPKPTLFSSVEKSEPRLSSAAVPLV